MLCCRAEPDLMVYRHDNAHDFDTAMGKLTHGAVCHKALVMKGGRLATQTIGVFQRRALRRELPRYLEANDEFINGDLSDRALAGLRKLRWNPVVLKDPELSCQLRELVQRVDNAKRDALVEEGKATYVVLMKERLLKIEREWRSYMTVLVRENTPSTDHNQAFDKSADFWEEYSKETLDLFDEYLNDNLVKVNINPGTHGELLKLARALEDEWLESALMAAPRRPLLLRNYAIPSRDIAEGDASWNQYVDIENRRAKWAWTDCYDYDTAIFSELAHATAKISWCYLRSDESEVIDQKIRALHLTAEGTQNWRHVTIGPRSGGSD